MTRTLIQNATVWTGQRLPDGSIFTTDAVLFDGPRILALGETARALEADTIVDAAGGFIAPAFGDGHVHPLFGGLENEFASVRGATSPQEIAAAVGEWAREHPEAAWVRGEGFDITLAPEGIFHAAWLDAEVPDRPVLLRASDYHTVWVNSEALRRAAYGPGIQQPHDGEIVLDADGRPIGTLREWGAWRPVYDLMPPVSADTVMRAMAYATESLAAAGITWVQDAWVEADTVDAWIDAARQGVLAVDLDLGLWCDPNTWREQIAEFITARDRVNAAGLAEVTCRTVKFFADGVIESATGALLEPYCDCPHSRGLPNWEASELREAVAAVDAAGFNAHIHAIGDFGVRMALDAFEYAASSNSPRDRRGVIAHAQLIDAADLDRFAELGVIANFEPYWSQQDSWQIHLTMPRLGSERANRQYQTASLARRGAAVSFGSDWPVTTYEPLAGIQVAVTRKAAADGPTWMPEECLTVDEALGIYTTGVAYQAGRPDAGLVRPGARSDLVWLSADPRRVDPMAIASIEVLGTWRRGITTYRG